MNNNLRPEKRMNSKGHLVTKWVRPESDAQAVCAMPQPVITQRDPAYGRVGRRIKDMIEQQLMTVPSDIKYQDIVDEVNRLDPRTIEYLDVIQEDMDDYYLDCMVISAIHNKRPEIIDDMTYIYLNSDTELDDLSGFTGWNDDGLDGESMIHSVLKGLEERPIKGLDYQIGRQPTRLSDDGSDSKISAVYNALSYLQEELNESEDKSGWNYETRVAWIADKELAELVVEYHERSDEVMSIMRDRDTAEADIIRLILDEKSALRSGVL